MLAHRVLRLPPHRRPLKSLDLSSAAFAARATEGRSDKAAMRRHLPEAPRAELLAVQAILAD